MRNSVSIIGSGVMGSGVAQLFAQYKYQVFLIDQSQQQLNKAKDRILKRLRYEALVNKADSLNKSDVMDRITFTTLEDSLMASKFIIENITENWNLKKVLYSQLNKVCSKECIVGVNTSAIPITKIASLLDNPERVIGIHFMNPVPMMPLVELIRGYHTSEFAIKEVTEYLKSVNRKCILVNDSPGFVTNRAMMLFVNEAIFMLQEHIASVEDIDTLFRQCFGHKMGPLQTADLIGLDTILYSLDVLYEEFNDSKYRPCPLLKKMVAAGLYGEKTKQGFYSYA